MKKLALIFYFCFLFSLGFSLEANLVLENNSIIPYLKYDRINETFGSFSYKDNSLVNPNVYLLICDINESFINSTIDLMYASESGNLSQTVLSALPIIHTIFDLNGTNCSKIDIDISAFRAVYPGVPWLKIFTYNYSNVTVEENVTVNNTTQTVNKTYLVKEIKILYFSKLNQSFNGSYLLGIDIDDISKKTFIKVFKIFDENKTEIFENVSLPYLFISIVKNNENIAEKAAKPNQFVDFDYMFKGEEKVYVNGLLSLKVKVVDPCSLINESGYYYVVNRSAWNQNSSCLKIENVSNIVIDFANKTIDGNADINGSFAKEVCGIIVKNVENVTLKDVRVQEFNRGICIINSKNVKIIGTSDQANLDGIYLINSTSRISNIYLKNNASEIFSKNNSYIELNFVRFATANLTAKAKDIIAKNVFNPPKDPQGLINISQWINISKNSDDSWLYRISFHFIFPNRLQILPKAIYKFDGVFINGSWYNETWEMLFPVYVDVANRIIFADLNLTNFSIFAPYGERVNITVPKPLPVPKPTPTPKPTEVPGPVEKAIPPRLNLTLDIYEIKVQQGETVEIGFNLTNEGNIDVYNALVIPDVRRGWKTSPIEFDLIRINETKRGKFYFTVYENEIPGVYFIPVRAVLKQNNVTVDVEILKVIVIPRKRLARMEILELPPFLTLYEKEVVPIAILVRNNGDFNLTEIKLFIQFGENCIESVEGSYDLKIGEKKSLVYSLKTKEAGQTCKTLFILKSKEGAIAFAPVVVKIVPKPFIKIRLLPILVVMWSILTLYIIIRRKVLLWNLK